jgi:1-acyl-sn-glycerol-3-phosphate acyltransferase
MDILKSLIVWLTGICFMVILFPLTFIIWLIVMPFDRERVVIHWLLVYQSFLLSRMIPIWKIEVNGREKIVPGTTYVYISNHQSILDILLLNSLLCKFRWISKVENIKVPVLGWYLQMAKYITVNRGNEESKAEMLEKSLDCLKRGISIMIFPEGTRSMNKVIGFFKRGAFQLAIEAEVPILPVLIDGTGGILPRHGFIFSSGYHIKIRVLDQVNPSQFNKDTPEELALKICNLMTRELRELRSPDITG